MFGSLILEVAIGIVFVYLLVSIICSAVREGIEAWCKTRAAYLEYGIRQLLRDEKGEGLAKSLYTHPLISGLFSGVYKPGSTGKRPLLARGGDLPSYIPTKNFAAALIDLAARGPDGARMTGPITPLVSSDAMRKSISTLGNPAVERVLLSAIDAAQGDLNKLQASLEAWYDSSMDRVSGWYKRSTQWIIFIIALVIAGAMNINTITIAEHLYTDNTARAAMLAKVEANSNSEDLLKQNHEEARNYLEAMTLPIGWEKGLESWRSPRKRLPATPSPAPGTAATTTQGTAAPTTDPYEGIWNYVICPVLGLLMTALAATMGAPFWFDILNKVMVIRSTVKPNEKSPAEGSEDRQPAKSKTAAPTPSPQVGTRIALASTLLASTALDDQNDVDGCEVEIDQITADEHLPAAEGGVA